MKLLWFYISRTIVALATVGGLYLLLLPALGIGALSVGVPPAFIALVPLALTVFMLVVGLAVAHWSTAVFKATIKAVTSLFSPRSNSAKKPVIYAAGFSAVVFAIAGFGTGKIGELIGTLVALAINSLLATAVLWFVSGTWRQPRERADAVPPHLETLLHNLTEACKDFFAPTADYTYKEEVQTRAGKTRTETRVDESARYADTRAAIETLQEVAPHKYRIKFRNTTGMSDQKFITFFEGVASVLSLHSYDLRDDDNRKGHIQVTVLDEEPTNKITVPHGMLLWK